MWENHLRLKIHVIWSVLLNIYVFFLGIDTPSVEYLSYKSDTYIASQ